MSAESLRAAVSAGSYRARIRPDRFLKHLTATAITVPGVTRAEPVPDDERSKRPYLLAVEAGGKATRWQVVAVSAPGDKSGEPEREPVTGPAPAAPVTAPAAVGGPDQVEAALIAALLAADSGEIATVDPYSQRATPGAIAHGATILFHDGSKIFLNHVGGARRKGHLAVRPRDNQGRPARHLASHRYTRRPQQPIEDVRSARHLTVRALVHVRSSSQVRSPHP